MRALALLLLCIFGSTLVSLTVANNGIGPDSCCFLYYERKVQLAKIRSYEFTDGRCSKPAVILQTIGNVRICVDPEAAWVQSAMTRLDQRNF
ncbi:monocyte chemotactic protein 1B-like [Gadus macrocephalus]|uniref:monocyte chemotactic protein 1B-like n=1 Tax=Gadus macrocephalus TaxID=80720 RepID=UPI0028CBB188|nr:monocyte chemotactic protein 1B-like [Gadus macrocephalus]